MRNTETRTRLSEIPCGISFYADEGVNLAIGKKMFWKFEYEPVNTENEKTIKTKQPIIAQFFTFQHKGIKFGLMQGLAVSYQ